MLYNKLNYAVKCSKYDENQIKYLHRGLVNKQVRNFIVFCSKLDKEFVWPRITAVDELETGFCHQRYTKRRGTVDGTTSLDGLKSCSVENLF